MKMRRTLAVGLAVGLVVLGTGCSDDGDDVVASTTSVPVDDGEIEADFTVKAKDYDFDMPDEVEGGVVTMAFENTGKVKHEAVIMSTGDLSLEQALKEFTPVIEGQGAPISPKLDFSGGAATQPAGGTTTSTLTLPEGDYVMVCTLTDLDSVEGEVGEQADAPAHMNIGMAKPFTVKGIKQGDLPDFDGSVTARDYAFDVTALKPGAQTLVFKNVGPREIHFAELFEFGEGVTGDAALAAMKALFESEGAPPEGAVTPTEDFSGTSPVFSPGGGGSFDVELKAGRTYVFACFVNDRAGGPPHAIGNGMLAAATVAG